MWDIKVCDELKEVITNLRSGNKAQRQRAENALDAINRVKENPTLPKYIKYDMDQYRAADVLAQYRIFFEMIKEDNVVHFVWMNDEDSIHDTNNSTSDKCYDVFVRLVKGKKLPKYIKKTAPEFTLSGNWREQDFIYAKLKEETGSAQSSLFVNGLNQTPFSVKI